MYPYARAQEQTVSKKTDADRELEDNVEVAEAPLSDEVKCDNHPARKARTFTGNGAYSLNLCTECTPPWFEG